MAPTEEVDEWVAQIDEVTGQIKGIIDGSITDFDDFDKRLELKERAKQIRVEERNERLERAVKLGREGKGAGTDYKWWCRRCFVEYRIDLQGNTCTRCQKSDMILSQQQRRDELMGKLETFKQQKATHHFRKDKWLRWKKSQAMLKRSRYINYKAWEYWEPDTDTEDEGDPIVPRDNPEFLAMEADMRSRKKKNFERSATARKFRERGNEHMKSGDFISAIESYEEGLECRRDQKSLWTNKALAEIKVFRYHDAIASCNKVIEYSEIFEDGFTKSADACFKAFTRRAQALRALHRWKEAVDDLEDAVKLFPKNREASELLEKTRAACSEATDAETLRGEDSAFVQGTAAATAGGSSARSGSLTTSAKEQVRPDGSVRITIEESEDEDEDVLVLRRREVGSLARFSAPEFASLVARLDRDVQERLRFCTRGAVTAVEDGRKVRDYGRKIDIRIEEVAEPSRLDGVLKDAERCCIIFRKRAAQELCSSKVTPAADCLESRDDALFLHEVTPRFLQVLHILSSKSDHHCELSAMSARHVLPFLSSESWRYMVLELLHDWSQRSVSAKMVAEFLGRYPQPYLALLIETVTEETKANVLPPGFESRSEAAAQAVQAGDLGLDSALDEVLQGLTKPSMAELAIAILGNTCLAGQLLPVFKEQLAPFCDDIMTAFKRRLRAADWRLCGRTAGAICNILRLGDCFAAAVHDRCLEALITCLREEKKDGSGSALFLRDLQTTGEQLGFRKATGRLLGALVNLMAVRPASAEAMLRYGALDVCVELVDPDATSVEQKPLDDETPEEVSLRAAQVCSSLLSHSPEAPTPCVEFGILKRAYRSLELASSEGGGCGFSLVSDTLNALVESTSTRLLQRIDLSVRLLTTVLLKTPGALSRLLADSGERSSFTIQDVVRLFLKLIIALQPAKYLGSDEEDKTASRLRGNLSLFFSCLVERQAQTDVPVPLKQLDFSALVAPLIDTLRKERGKAQHNVGVCVTRLAQSTRYRELVRNLNGIETLHQVQLPRVEAQKERDMKLHRLRGSVSTLTGSAKPAIANSVSEETPEASSLAAVQTPQGSLTQTPTNSGSVISQDSTELAQRTNSSTVTSTSANAAVSINSQFDLD